METYAELACLMYHEVTDDPTSSGFQRPAARNYTLTRAAFAGHLAGFRAAGIGPAPITGVPLTEPGPHLLLTFDDGGRSALYAAEELAKLGWAAHFFVVTARIGERT